MVARERIDYKQGKNGHAPTPEAIPKNLRPIFETYRQVSAEKDLALNPHQERRVITLAVFTRNPKDVKPLAIKVFQTTPTIAETYIGEAYADLELKALGHEIFDRHKEKMKETQQKKKYREINKNDLIIKKLAMFRKVSFSNDSQILKKRFIEVLLRNFIGEYNQEHQPPKKIGIDDLDNDELSLGAMGFIERLPQSRDRDIVLDALHGMNNQALAERYNLKKNTIAKILSHWRVGFVEPEILFPIGLTRITKAGSPDLALAAYNKTLPTYEILSIKYATQQQLQEHESRKKIVDPTMFEKGYILLNENATDSEYTAIMENPEYASKVILKYHRRYIMPEILAQYRAQKKTMNLPESNEIGYKKISRIARTRKESQKIRHAVERGLIKYELNGRGLFVDPKDGMRIISGG